MVFSSYSFLGCFLPITLAGYHLLRLTNSQTAVKLWLTAASLTFYGLGQLDFLPWFALTILVNYLTMVLLNRASKRGIRRLLLALSTAWNLGLLFWFKYLDFTISNINWLFKTSIPPVEPVLPIGISFFTFQILLFTIGLYRGEYPLPTLLDYAVFISFFPQLIVGPVVRRDEMMPAIEDSALLQYDGSRTVRGIFLFSIGCAKKVLLADRMTAFASTYYGGAYAQAGVVWSWAAVLAYTFAYYFDFSGYIDMARGLGELFGVTLPINFDSPYKARNFADFWRRWNITISRFFSDTVFSSLFGFGDGLVKLVFATMVTFLASGLWHGAAWHFIVWGLVNGLLVAVANIRVVRGRRPMPKALAVTLTFLTGALVRVLFDCSSLSQAAFIYREMFRFGEFAGLSAFFGSIRGLLYAEPLLCCTLLASGVICFLFPNSNDLAQRPLGWKSAMFSAVLLAVSVLCMRKVSTFLYFNF